MSIPCFIGDVKVMYDTFVLGDLRKLILPLCKQILEIFVSKGSEIRN